MIPLSAARNRIQYISVNYLICNCACSDARRSHVKAPWFRPPWQFGGSFSSDGEGSCSMINREFIGQERVMGANLCRECRLKWWVYDCREFVVYNRDRIWYKHRNECEKENVDLCFGRAIPSRTFFLDSRNIRDVICRKNRSL